jgi:cytochrome c5
MSEIHVEEHASLIRTPKQLIIVVVLSFAVPIGLVAILASFVAGGGDYSKGNPQMSDEAIAKRLQPVGTVAISEGGARGAETSGQPAAPPVAAAAPVSAPARAASAVPAAAGGTDFATGKAVYEKTCQVCHAAGIAGAPKAGDKAAWAAHLARGMDDLYKNAIKGIKAMPPKGGNPSLSDAEVKAAVDYMVSLVK